MNWTNYDRLVQHLENLIVTAPSEFNYGSWMWRDDSGCLACHCRFVATGRHADSCVADIHRFIECTMQEAVELYHAYPWRGAFGTNRYAPQTGADGIREALRRLSILATRYERPTSEVPMPAGGGNAAPSSDPMPASLRATLDAITREMVAQ